MTQDIVDCYCGDEEDDGTMLYCEKCKKWQHAICVNWNDFTAPAKYICPTCQNMQIECICQTEGDYQHAIIQCSKCHLYQHKRHVGLGIGKNPPSYVCSGCSPNYGGSKKIQVEPHLDFFPSFNEKMIPVSVESLPFSLPSSKLLSKLKEFTYPTTPVNFASSLLISYRNTIFKSHPTLQYFEFSKYTPELNIQDACNFFGYLTKSISFMSNLSIPQVIQIFDHVISLLVYKKAIPRAFRTRVNDEIKDEDLIIQQSDRAQDYLRNEYTVTNFTPPKNEVELEVVSGHNAYPTMITLTDLYEGDFICKVAGYCMDYEEIDQQNTVPDFAVFGVARSKLFINSTRVPNSPSFLHIRRGMVSNCEIRLFTTYIKGTKKKETCAGVFATKPLLMQQLMDYDPISGKQSLRADEIAIHSGEELVLPFDLPPLIVKPEAEWRTSSDQPVIDKDCSIDINEYKPLRPSQCHSFNYSLELDSNRSSQVRERKRQKEEHFEPTETTLSNLFSQNEPIHMDFILESTFGGLIKNKPSTDSETEDDGFEKPRVSACIHNQEYDDKFLLTPKKPLNSIEDRKHKHLVNPYPANQYQTLSNLIPIDPLQGKKTWFQPMHHKTEIPEMKIEYRDEWSPLNQPQITKTQHRKLTPAEFWCNDPADFVEITEEDLG